MEKAKSVCVCGENGTNLDLVEGDHSVVAAEARKLPHLATQSGDNEWYTPSEYVEAARTVMGAIDLDPASNPVANQVVQATVYYSESDDGLQHGWNGRVWMNPPYSAGLVDKFVDKLAMSVESGTVSEAVVLVNNSTETRWFARLVGISSVVCFPRKRITFWKPGKKSATPPRGQCVVYVGKNEKKFRKVFQKFGYILKR